MSNKYLYRYFCIVFFALFVFNAFCQKTINLDSLESFEQREIIKKHVNKALKQSLIPGFSQIKNKQMWKIPFYYGGFVALGSFAIGHHALYKKTQNEYLDYYKNNLPFSYYHFNNRADYDRFLERSPVLVEYGKEYDELERLFLSANRHKRLSYLYTAGLGFLYSLNLCDGIHPVLKNYRSPYKAGLYSALVPGLGQAYNQHYWKVPIVYAALAVEAYFINFTHMEYKKNLQAYYIKLVDNAENGASEYLSKNKKYYADGSYWDEGNLTRGKYYLLETFLRLDQKTANQLLLEKERWKRYRDLNILGFVAIYAVNIVDASVYSHLFDYDISDVLSIKLRPNFINILKEPVNIGFSLAMNF